MMTARKQDKQLEKLLLTFADPERRGRVRGRYARLCASDKTTARAFQSGLRLLKMKKENQRLSDAIAIDDLTQLPNRKAFPESFRKLYKSIHRACVEANEKGGCREYLVVLMLDIDRFKVVNDTYGHQSGDDVLKHVAKILGEAARGNDVLFRWGGEEFLGLFRCKESLTDFSHLPERLRKTLAKTPCIDRNGRKISVTVSIGGAILMPTQEGTNDEIKERADMLIEAADKALYQAKKEGRNRVCFSLLNGNGMPNFPQRPAQKSASPQRATPAV